MHVTETEIGDISSRDIYTLRKISNLETDLVLM